MHLAYCGFDCTECPVYQATKTKDENLRSELLARYHTPENNLTLAKLYCEGCLSASASQTKFCCGCTIRLCAEVKGIDTCAACKQYPCEIIEESLPLNGQGRKRLDSYRS